MDLHLQGSRPPSGRPVSGRPQSRINPITGEEVPLTGQTPRASQGNRHTPRTGRDQAPSSRQESRPHSRPQGVPALKLGRLADQDEDRTFVPLEMMEHYKSKLDTPNTASTVSWGTPTSQHGASQQHQHNQSQPAPGSQRSHRKPVARLTPKPRQPSAWDKDPVPENLPPPPQKYKDQFKQYEEDMKAAYRKKCSQNDPKVQEAKVAQKVEELKLTYESDEEEIVIDDEADQLQKDWTSTPYSKAALLKKMDVEELEEEKRKNKLIETVMIDQLSRHVICDPEQDQILSGRAPSHRPGMQRGTVRRLHDSKVSTSGSNSENLLSRRVRFGARVLSSNGRDAVRELTGFLFAVDNTITIYEFRIFGKSAKALPFINRGRYPHLKGRRTGEIYTLADIYPGATLVFKAAGQDRLPDTMRGKEYAVFKVTDIDQPAKAQYFHESIGECPTTSREDKAEERLLKDVQGIVRQQLKKRGIKTFTGLNRLFQELDENGDGMINKVELEKCLIKFHIDIPQEKFDDLWEILDADGSNFLDYSEFVRGFFGEMNESRKGLVRKAFHKMDGNNKGSIRLSDMGRFYNVHKHPKVRSGELTEAKVRQSLLGTFSQGCKEKDVTYAEFEAYYEGLSVCVDRDEDFFNIMKNAWNI